MNDTERKIAQLALLLQEEHNARLAAKYSHAQRDDAQIRPGRVYTKIDIGGSGKLMIDNKTGEIFGIKGYGQVHKGHRYGTLDTTGAFYWGEYYPRERTVEDGWPSPEYATIDVTPAPVKAPSLGVGDKVTRHIGSDADPWTVISVSDSGKTAVVQADKAELDPTWHPDFRPGGFAGHVANNADQRWIITPDPEGVTTTIRWTLRGWAHLGTPFSEGSRRHYDYNF